MIANEELLPYAIIITAIISISYYYYQEHIISRQILNPKVFKSFKLIKKTHISHDTSKYRFQLPYPNAMLNLPVGQHISIMAEINGKKISRSYTPTAESKGHFDLVIKSYPTGNISKLMGELKVGDSVGMRGPKGNFSYKCNMVRHIGMIAGGTGITPMLQIIRRVCTDPADHTKIDLIFGNGTEDDILCREDLDQLAKEHDQFSVHYVLEKPPVGWQGEVGWVTKEMIQKYCPKPAKDIKLLLCGPLGMVKSMIQATNDLGYDKPRAVSKPEDQVYKF
ncbi:hypothetical protein BDF20DRAFT_911131 [Mycotypha africana]|uniref:uncharacterized protein n=1 Tax=Mycotypha africana TaxID=64632 RepID=UPI002301230A|nr:uncharacterized protein BDF20DRAFT_911131 [Mycotypha africana]KAI8983946.1 hypothetical protein BDF20DRAFT_911131 [Mycotypha africana]